MLICSPPPSACTAEQTQRSAQWWSMGLRAVGGVLGDRGHHVLLTHARGTCPHGHGPNGRPMPLKVKEPQRPLFPPIVAQNLGPATASYLCREDRTGTGGTFWCENPGRKRKPAVTG